MKNQPNETRITVIEMQYGRVHQVHQGEIDQDYAPFVVMYTATVAPKPITPFNAYYILLGGEEFWILADPDNNTWHLTRDICRASLFDAGSLLPAYVPSNARTVPAQYFDGHSHEEIVPSRPSYTPQPLPPALPAAPPATVAEPTLIDGWTHVKLGNLFLTVSMPDENTAYLYLFKDDIFSGPQLAINQPSDNDDGSHNAIAWLPSLGITGQDGIFFTSGMHRDQDFLGVAQSQINLSTALGQVTIKRKQ